MKKNIGKTSDASLCDEVPPFPLIPPHVRSERLRQCLGFTHYCQVMATKDTDFARCLLEIMNQATASYSDLVNGGNPDLAANLPCLIDQLDRASKNFKRLVTRMPRSYSKSEIDALKCAGADTSKIDDFLSEGEASSFDLKRFVAGGAISVKRKRGRKKDCSKDVNRFVSHFIKDAFWNCGGTEQMNLCNNPKTDSLKKYENRIMRELRSRFPDGPVLSQERVTGWKNGSPIISSQRVCVVRPFALLLKNGSVKSGAYYDDHGTKIISKDVSGRIPLMNADKTHQWNAIKDAVRQSLKTILPKMRA